MVPYKIRHDTKTMENIPHKCACSLFNINSLKEGLIFLNNSFKSFKNIIIIRKYTRAASQ